MFRKIWDSLFFKIFWTVLVFWIFFKLNAYDENLSIIFPIILTFVVWLPLKNFLKYLAPWLVVGISIEFFNADGLTGLIVIGMMIYYIRELYRKQKKEKFSKSKVTQSKSSEKMITNKIMQAIKKLIGKFKERLRERKRYFSNIFSKSEERLFKNEMQVAEKLYDGWENSLRLHKELSKKAKRQSELGKIEKETQGLASCLAILTYVWDNPKEILEMHEVLYQLLPDCEKLSKYYVKISQTTDLQAIDDDLKFALVANLQKLTEKSKKITRIYQENLIEELEDIV